MPDSDLLPVLSTSAPQAFERLMRTLPRRRAWRFSLPTPTKGSPIAASSAAHDTSNISLMGTVRVEMPRLAASALASTIEESLE